MTVQKIKATRYVQYASSLTCLYGIIHVNMRYVHSCALKEMDDGNEIVNVPLSWQNIVECSMLSNKLIELQKSVPRSINPMSIITSIE